MRTPDDEPSQAENGDNLHRLADPQFPAGRRTANSWSDADILFEPVWDPDFHRSTKRDGGAPNPPRIGFSESAGSKSLIAKMTINTIVALFPFGWKNADISDSSQRLLVNLLVRRGDEAFEERMRLVRLAQKLGMKLARKVERMGGEFDDFHELAIG